MKGKILIAALVASILVVGCSSAEKPAEGTPASGTASTAGATPGAAATSKFAAAKPILELHCQGCHGGDRPAAGVDFSKIATDEDAAKNKDVLAKAAMAIETGKMPPPKGTPLSDADKKTVLEGLKG